MHAHPPPIVREVESEDRLGQAITARAALRRVTLLDTAAASTNLGDHIIMEANPNAETNPRLPRIVVRHVAEPASQLLLLQKGDADVAGNSTRTS